MREKILQNFVQAFDDAGDPRVFFSPGRVNLIGEHIDYNGGYVFPCAINLGTYGVIRKRTNDDIVLVSSNFSSSVQFTLSELVYDAEHSWGNYPKGLIHEMIKAGHKLDYGFDMYVYGNLPSGAGLSSSASLLSLVGVAINTVFDLGIDRIELAKMCQRAEHFNNVSCGIMDMFICLMGKQDHAVLLNCDTLEYQYAPLNLGDYRILIANTNYRRGLADSKYNERLAQCRAALADLQEVVDIKQLCELSPDEYDKLNSAVKDPTNRKRAEHAVVENYRTIAAAQALSEGRIDGLYGYMQASHLSLRDLYDVVGDALDALVQPMYDYAEKHNNPPRVLGARMTGAGFGGCTVNIVHKDYLDDIKQFVGDAYAEATGIQASFYVAEVAGGTEEI